MWNIERCRKGDETPAASTDHAGKNEMGNDSEENVKSSSPHHMLQMDGRKT